ncbi:MAG: hypothetical protein IH926_05155 [Proteobacteria bacterium]|nr:hypothetical protein [Pseudomonadota bacterium]
MRVRYSYLPQQFGAIDDLFDELRRFVPTGGGKRGGVEPPIQTPHRANLTNDLHDPALL